MTRTEAAAVLDLPEGAPLGELRRRFEALHNDYQIRLTNAPTAALKKTYQQKLQELIAAADVLQPGFSATTQGSGDLPSPEPILSDLSVAPRPAQVQSVSRPVARTVTQDSADEESGGLPRSTIVAAVGAVVLAAALSFSLLRWSQASARIEALQSEGNKLLAAAKALQAQIDRNDRILFADRLRVRNGSSKPIKITMAALVYRDQTGALKLAHSGNYHFPSWEMRPGGTAQLDADMARGRLWDGPVLYYAFLIEYPDVEPFLKAGIWAEDVDRLDKVVTLDLD